MSKLIFSLLIIVGILLPFHSLIIRWIDSEYMPYWKEFLIFAIAYLALLGIIISRAKSKILLSKIHHPVFFFMSICCLSAVLHPSLLSLRGLAGYILYAIVFFIFVTHIKIQQITLLLTILICTGLILGIGSIIQIFFVPDLFGLTKLLYTSDGEIIRAGSFMGGSPITLGWFLSLLLPVSFSFYLVEKKRILSMIYFISCLIFLAGIVFTFSRSAYLQIIISFIALLFICKYKLRLRIIKKIFLISLLFIIFWGYAEYKNPGLSIILFNRFFSSFNPEINSETVRIERWKTTLSFIFSEYNLLLGAGPGTGWHFGTIETVQTSQLLKKLSEKIPGDPAPESSILLLLADLGIFGFVAFILFYVKFILLGIEQIRNSKIKDIKNASICLGTTSGLIGLSGSLLFSMILSSWPAIFLFWIYCAIISVVHHSNIKKMEMDPHF